MTKFSFQSSKNILLRRSFSSPVNNNYTTFLKWIMMKNCHGNKKDRHKNSANLKFRSASKIQYQQFIRILNPT